MTITNFSPDPRTYKDGEIIPGNNLYGVEVELEDCLLSGRHSSYWERKHDDSLRGEFAYEFVTAVPFSGMDLEKAVEELTNLITYASTTSRCSVHLHVDVRDWTLSHFKSFILHYLSVEKILVKTSGNREENIFCWPYYRTGFFTPFIGAMYTKESEKVYVDSFKYTALNFKSMGDLGSLEFRIHKGTYDSEKILRWINIVSHLVEYTRNENNSFKDLPEFYSGKGPIQFLEGIFGDLTEDLIYNNISEDLISGIRNAQYVLNSDTFSKYHNLDSSKIGNSLFDKITKGI